MISLGLSPGGVPAQRRGAAVPMYGAADRKLWNFTVGDDNTMFQGSSDGTNATTPTKDLTAATVGWWFECDAPTIEEVNSGEYWLMRFTDDGRGFSTGVKLVEETDVYGFLPEGRPFLTLDCYAGPGLYDNYVGSLYVYADVSVIDGALHQIAFSFDLTTMTFYAMVDGAAVDCVVVNMLNYTTYPGFQPVLWRSNYASIPMFNFDDGPPFNNVFKWGEAILAPGFLDLTQPAVQRRFVEPTTGKPADIADADNGPAGRLLTGQTPLWYYSGWETGQTVEEFMNSVVGDYTTTYTAAYGSPAPTLAGPVSL